MKELIKDMNKIIGNIDMKNLSFESDQKGNKYSVRTKYSKAVSK